VALAGMSTATFVPATDADAFRSAIAAWLAEDTVPFSLICGVVDQIPGRGGWAGVICVGGEPRLALAQTPPMPVTLAAPGAIDADCVRCACALLQARTPAVRGLNGISAWAEAIAAGLAVRIRSRQRLRLHRLDGAARLPRATPGRSRRFHPAEMPLVRQWRNGFHEETSPEDPPPSQDLAEIERRRDEYLAWTLDDQPVSVAQQRRPLLGGWTISGVYTPPALRGRGYAGAAVHALATHLQERGSRYVILFTDLGNPTSNRLYARIGFVPVLDQVRLDWGAL
jgi:predicted GNAT family acetyltransferase